MEISKAELKARGVRVIWRDWGPVILTDRERNDVHFRGKLAEWLDTPDGRAWSVEQGLAR